MFNLKPTYPIAPDLLKYIRESTYKSIERKVNQSNPLTLSVPSDDDNSNVGKIIVLMTLAGFISFLAGYHYNTLKN